jgi:D-alanine-D-alanine ligase
MVNQSLHQYFYWVLAPQINTSDDNIEYYYDFTQSIAEYTAVFKELNLNWKWQPVTMDNYHEVIADIAASANGLTPLVINLCDGDEINGAPGVSIIHQLEAHNLIYTGSADYFYQVTTSKIPMKEAFDDYGVPNALWEAINIHGDNIPGIFDRLGCPLIIKPAISGGSMGLTVKNVVHNETEMRDRIKELNEGYRGWDFTYGGLIAEQFIKGREFTTFVTGSCAAGNVVFYHPVERVFHQSLPEEEQFLSFERLWEIYEEEKAMPDNAYVYEYQAPPENLVKNLEEISLQAYQSVKGTGYGRMDIRMDAAGNLYMLEVNAQCGLSEDEDYTSIGAIIKQSGKTFTALVTEVINDAIKRFSMARELKPMAATPIVH